jgi:hypothetical protein
MVEGSTSWLTFGLYLVVALVAKILSLILLVARWLSTVWFGMINTLLSSLCGVVPFRILLPRKPGNVGGVGRLFVVSLALLKRELSSGASRSSRYRGMLGEFCMTCGGKIPDGFSRS